MLDLAARLGVRNEVTLVERKVVVVEAGEAPLALCVDAVRDPEEFERDAVFAPPKAGDDGPLRGAVRAVVRTAEGPMPVLEPAALVSAKLLRRLAAVVRTAQRLQVG